MAYVEWLRVRGCLKWTGIVLGVFVLVAVVLRVAVIGVEHNVYGWMGQLKTDPGSKVTESVLPDGTHRTVIDNPLKQMRVTVDDRGWNGKHVDVYDWSPTAKQDLTTHHVFGPDMSVDITPDRYGRGERLDVDTDGTTPFFNYLVPGLVVALIVATVLGAPFAREADGHLEVALTKPVSRELFALQTIAVDWFGLLAAFVGATIVAILVHAIFDLPHITFGQRDFIVLGAGILGPLAWYAMLAAATASVKRAYGAILGFAWPVAAIVLGLSLVQPGDNVLLTVVHNVAWALSWIDPLRYLHFGNGVASADASYTFMPAQAQLAVLAALALLYSAAAVLQWRRIEP